jgi:ribose transport system substrate-binding protein
VVNLDRAFPSAAAFRLQIKGDNYGMGLAAGQYIGEQLKAKGVANPIIGEIPGIDSLELTQERSQGFNTALAVYGFKVANRRPAEFTADSGQAAATALLQALPKMDALWNHDDDQGIGVLAAIKQANRSEFFMVGGAGSKAAIDAIVKDDSVLKATVTYSPSMASSAISLARLIGQGKGMSDLVELQVPKEITLASETITKENAEKYAKLGF